MQPSEAKRVCHFRLKVNVTSRQLILLVVVDPGGLFMVCSNISANNEREEVCGLCVMISGRTAQVVEGIDPSRPR